MMMVMYGAGLFTRSHKANKANDALRVKVFHMTTGHVHLVRLSGRQPSGTEGIHKLEPKPRTCYVIPVKPVALV
jgi:hypothetical protein